MLSLCDVLENEAVSSSARGRDDDLGGGERSRGNRIAGLNIG